MTEQATVAATAPASTVTSAAARVADDASSMTGGAAKQEKKDEDLVRTLGPTKAQKATVEDVDDDELAEAMKAQSLN
jgi:hypothetical protein